MHLIIPFSSPPAPDAPLLFVGRESDQNQLLSGGETR
jgi:hypothetical protein